MRVISKIQTMRKDAGFEVMDHICVSMQDNEKIADIVEKTKSRLSQRCLRMKLSMTELLDSQKSGI